MEMNKKRYQVDFLPLDKFFFSDENRYRLKSENNGLKLSMDYYQVSRQMPQQTTMLGVLRYIKLISIGQIPITDKQKAESAIGISSFRYKKEAQDFAAIGSVSPVGIGFGEETLFPNSFDLDKEGKRRKILKSTFNYENGSAYILDGYDEKKGLDHVLISSSGTIRTYDDVFQASESVGIKKNNRVEGSDDTLYKQTSYTLNDGYCFRIEVEIDLDSEKKDFIIPMGADGHLFKVIFKELEENKSLEKVENFNYVRLTGDCLINEFDIYKPIFTLTETVVFRHLRSVVKVQNSAYYHSKPYKNDDSLMPENQFSRSIKYSLLKRGSVFWFDSHNEAKDFTNLIDQEGNMKSIGYNHYTTEKVNI